MVTLVESKREYAPDFECNRLYKRIESILTDAGVNVTDKDYENPSSFYERVKSTPSYGDPNAFFEIDSGNGFVDIHGFSDDDHDYPIVTVQGTIDESVVDTIRKSVNSVEGWRFDSAMVRKIKESSSKRVNESSQEGWSVKHFTFDAAIRGKNASADSLGLSAHNGGKFFKDLCQFLADHGMEMAGDYIDAEDITDVYEDNDYEFFGED